MELYELTITEASKGLQEKKFSSSELTNACLERIKAVEPKLHALVTLTEEQALEQDQKVRTLIVEDFARAFEEVDVVIGPTSPSTALPVGSSKTIRCSARFPTRCWNLRASLGCRESVSAVVFLKNSSL
jgi:Asp-tRNA(Asn)/Glu-tRNA(Gln) amidotransferase A subunit family amidase